MTQETEWAADRPVSVLTTAQREYLRGERDVDGADERMMRSRIRGRLKAAIFDLSLVANTLPRDDLDEALSEPDDYDAVLGSSPPIIGRMYALPMLLYLFNREREANTPDRPDGWRTGIFVESGIESALTRMGVGYDSVDVSIEVTRAAPLEALAERDLTSLTKPQLTQLLRAGLISGDEHAQAWNDAREDPSSRGENGE